MQYRPDTMERQQYVLAISHPWFMPDQASGRCAAVATVGRPILYGLHYVAGWRPQPVWADEHDLQFSRRTSGRNSLPLRLKSVQLPSDAHKSKENSLMVPLRLVSYRRWHRILIDQNPQAGEGGVEARRHRRNIRINSRHTWLCSSITGDYRKHCPESVRCTGTVSRTGVTASRLNGQGLPPKPLSRLDRQRERMLVVGFSSSGQRTTDQSRQCAVGS